MNADIRHIEAIMPEEEKHDLFFKNYWGERYIYKQTKWGSVREDMPGALCNAVSMDDLKNFNWPTNDEFDYSNIKSLCGTHDEYAIIYGFADIWERPALIRGLENAFLDIVENPEWVHYLARKFTDFYKEDYLRANTASNGRIDIYLIYSDIGGQNGPLIIMV